MKSKPIRGMIKALDQQNTQYFIGPIQSPPRWIESDYDNFWNDLISDTNPTEKQSHFIGSAIFKPVSDDVHVNYYSVTDGQQRLTTIYLIICAICAFVKHKNIPEEVFSYKNVKKLLLINETQKGDDYFKVLLRRTDRDTLKMIVNDLPEKLSKNAGSPKLIKGYNYFYNKLTLENYEEIFEKLYYMTFCEINIENGDNETTVYNSINNGGRPLSLFDSVWAVLMGPYDLQKQKELEANYWKDLTINNNLTNTITSSFVVYKSSTLRPNSKIIDFYNSQEDPEQCLKELSEYSILFNKIHKSDIGDAELNCLLRGLVMILPGSHLTGIVSACSLYLNGELPYNSLKKILELILNAVMRVYLKTNKVSQFRTILESNITWLYSENPYTELYKRIQPFFISDNEFINSILNKNFYKGKSELFAEENKNIPSNINTLVRYLLGCIENSYYSKAKINPGDYTLEHICPQNLKNGWEHLFSEEDYHNYVHTLGNLTLTAYNSEYSNKPFEDKKNMKNGFKDDRLHLNKCLCDKTTWTVDLIKQRTESLAEQLCEIFKCPESNTLFNESGRQVTLMPAK